MPMPIPMPPPTPPPETGRPGPKSVPDRPRHPTMEAEAVAKDWWLYHGTGEAEVRRARLEAGSPPPWRDFTGTPDPGYEPPGCAGPAWERTRRRGEGYVPDGPEKDVVNTALHLRRPLLITGKPGVGKSTLAYSIAADLDLGPVLHWPITSRTVLRDGLYLYDAIGRLQEAGLEQLRTPGAAAAVHPGAAARAAAAETAADPAAFAPDPGTGPSIARYLRLGPLGTALLPQDRPRVLLVDEIDKSDIDLPGDLLTVFEDGGFDIPELARLAKEDPTVAIGTDDDPDSRRTDQPRPRPVPVLPRRGPHQQRRTRLPARLPAPLRPAAPGTAGTAEARPHRAAAPQGRHRRQRGVPGTRPELPRPGRRRRPGHRPAPERHPAPPRRSMVGPRDRERFLGTVMQHLTGPTA